MSQAAPQASPYPFSTHDGADDDRGSMRDAVKLGIGAVAVAIGLAAVLAACAPMGEVGMESGRSSEGVAQMEASQEITPSSTVGEIEALPEFAGSGRLLFPIDRPVSDNMTLDDLSRNGIYLWYSNMNAQRSAHVIASLKAEADAGEQIFYPLYAEEEQAADPSLADTGLFFFRGEPGAPFAIVCAGGGFAYVAALHDSFPQAEAIASQGLNAFALIYRPDHPYEDLARAIEFIVDNAAALQVDPQGYSLWGGSAGARMAAVLGNTGYLQELTGRQDLPSAAAVIMQYTGYSYVSSDDAPTYICVGTRDGIADWRIMKRRSDALAQRGIPTEFHAYEGLSHGFGLGEGTVAEGWLDDAIAFWERSRRG